MKTVWCGRIILAMLKRKKKGYFIGTRTGTLNLDCLPSPYLRPPSPCPDTSVLIGI